MKIKQYKSLLVALIAIVINIAGNSQQYPDSLLRYLEIAAENNPAVRQKFSEYQAALQKVPQAGSLADPELTLGVFLKPMELASGNQVANLRLMQMFPWFGVLKNARDEMSLMANAKFELFRDARLQIYYDVQRTWYELYKGQKGISASEENLEILKTIERLAVVRLSAAPSGSGSPSGSGIASVSASENGSVGSSGMQGMNSAQAGRVSAPASQASSSMQQGSMGSSSSGSALAEIYRIQIEAGELENNIAVLKNQERTVLALFNSYLNRKPLSPVITVESVSIDSPAFNLSAVSDSIIAKNPMLIMLQREKESLEARKKMVNGMAYPMVGLGLDYSVIRRNEMSISPMNGNDMLMPMVTVTLPIYRKKYNAMQSEAEFLKTATSYNYQATANSLQTEYYQAVQLYQDSQRRIKLYENQYLLATKSFDLVLKSYSASSSELTDVLRVHQQTLDYKLKQIEAVADFNTSVAWLKRLMAYTDLK